MTFINYKYFTRFMVRIPTFFTYFILKYSTYFKI